LKNKKLKSIAAFYGKDSPGAIESRRLYSNIMHISAGEENQPLKSVAVTSSTTGEGKSTMASLLAITAAEHGKQNVLLIDSDFRRAKIHELFGIENRRGLSDIFYFDASVKNCLRDTPFDRLKIITAGQSVSSVDGLPEMEKMAPFFDEVRFLFDFIVLDSAPVVPVTDVIDLSSRIDGILMVVKAGQTAREIVKHAVALLNNSGINILGVVLNDVGKVLPYYYDYGYYRYQSHSGKRKPGKNRSKKEPAPSDRSYPSRP
jgi:capsular exopolysaccharide synthesis family protein